MKTETPEERVAREWGKDKNITVTPVTLPNVEEPQPKTDQEAVEWAQGSAYLDSLIEDAWELLREECDEALKINPNDENAQKRLLQVQQHDRQKKTRDPAGLNLVVSKKVRTRVSDKRLLRGSQRATTDGC